MPLAQPLRSWPGRRTFAADLAVAVVNTAAILVMIAVAKEDGAKEQDALGYTLGVLMSAPVLVVRRRPLTVLLTVSASLLTYFVLGYPAIVPAAPLAVPLYLAVLAGRTLWAVGIPAWFYGLGFFFVTVVDGTPVLEAVAAFLPHMALAVVVILLGEVVVSRRELAAETRERLLRAEQEREREAARRVVEERVRIARELHDTVAHSMATITVQAGSALHRLEGPRPGGQEEVLAALRAIRVTSKDALREMRATLGVLRDTEGDGPPARPAGLDRLPALIDAVRAAGLRVGLEIDGAAGPVDEKVGHAAYRIVQESLTNVLRHAGPGAGVVVGISRRPGEVELRISDSGPGLLAGGGREGHDGGGYGLGGMRERAEAVGGTFSAEPGEDGGFTVSARLPLPGEEAG